MAKIKTKSAKNDVMNENIKERWNEIIKIIVEVCAADFRFRINEFMIKYKIKKDSFWQS